MVVRSLTTFFMAAASALISCAAEADSSALAAVRWMTISISLTALLICLIPSACSLEADEISLTNAVN